MKIEKPVCASCPTFDVTKIIKSEEQLKPGWLEETDYVRDFISKQSTTIRHRKNRENNIKIKLHKRYSGRKVLYWCANKKKDLAEFGYGRKL